MEKPRINTSLVYHKVAELLPTEGRDFTIDAIYDENHKTKMVITPLTPLGSAWVPFLQKELESPMQQDGVAVATGGVAAIETMTINSVRAKAEASAAEALKTRVKNAEASRDQKMAAARKAHSEQPGGENSNPTDQVRRAYREANDAAEEARILSAMGAKVAAIRSTIDDAARNAAKEDEKSGKFWSVDMNEPLSSLFDRQDVTAKFEHKERLISEIARKQVEIDNIMKDAVNIAKQYIIPKEG